MFHLHGKGAVARVQFGGALAQGAVGSDAADGDHRLLGEGFQQLDLAVGEAAGLDRTKRDRADHHAVALQRYC